jgi:CBS domain-containing protein
MQVREIMTQNPTCCTPESTIQDVAQMMAENDCGCIPVVNSLTEMKPVGTITDRDITIRGVAARHNPTDMRASEVMTADLATVTPQMSVEECFGVMEEREIRRVLVVDEQGKCCGIVAQADIVQSGVNPMRTHEVIREISESAPSRNQRISTRAGAERRDYESRSSRHTFMSGGSLLPLLIGLGSGIALTYVFNSQKSANRREYAGDFGYEHENRQDLTNQESYGKYVDAEQEIEQRQHNLENRVQTIRNEPNSPIIGTASVRHEDQTAANKEKGRTASQ